MDMTDATNSYRRAPQAAVFAPCAAAVALAAIALATPAVAQDAPRATAYAVGLRQVEHVDQGDGAARTLVMNVFYPAAVPDPSVQPVAIPMFTNVRAYRDAEIASAPARFPLIMLSHGRGSSGLVYAWFAEYLAARGYIVAALDHYRANRNDATIAYLANKLWQRPIDIGLDITYLINDPVWGNVIDPARIGIAGHSQGGFTSLWIGGAKVNADRYLAFQRRWRNDPTVPKHLRDELPVDAAPALTVADRRVKAAFAMAPGIVQAFGMDADGLAQMKIPAYITVGAGDTVTPPAENAVFAARYVPGAQLVVIPGPVGHEIFVNECSEDGKLELPESCVDAAGVDRARIHAAVGAAALQFFDANLRR
jgi:predicted dienelactone hydrolase